MKTKLPTKSESHADDINIIKDIILENYEKQIAFIILFGSFARGDWVYDYYTENNTDYEYASDYDFLIITKKNSYGDRSLASNFLNKIDKKLKRCGAPYKLHSPTVIIEPIDRVNRELEKGRYFFSDIKKEGVVLYDSKDFELKEAKELSHEEIKELVTDDFEQWFEGGSEFLKIVKMIHFDMKEKMLNKAAFILHQATESFLNCNLLVLNGYKPKLHDIQILLKQCSAQSDKFLKIFPQGKPEDKERFELLRKAYIESRYSKNYKITAEELEYLIEKVEYLQKVTKLVYEKRISSLS